MKKKKRKEKEKQGIDEDWRKMNEWINNTPRYI